MKKKILLALGVTLFLAGCPSVHSPLSEATSGASWMTVGVSTNNNTRHELDKSSVKRNGAVVSFRDKKTFDNPDLAHFASLPNHKTSVNIWEVNCKNKTYTLVSTHLFDKQGQSVYKQEITRDKRTYMSVNRGSAIEEEFNYVCK